MPTSTRVTIAATDACAPPGAGNFRVKAYP